MKLFSRNGVEVPRGGFEMRVGRAVLGVHKNGPIESISVHVDGAQPSAASRRWAAVNPSTLTQALRHAEEVGR